MLDPDQMNTDPKHCIKVPLFLHTYQQRVRCQCSHRFVTKEGNFSEDSNTGMQLRMGKIRHPRANTFFRGFASQDAGLRFVIIRLQKDSNYETVRVSKNQKMRRKKV
jgi:hypothetical protein